MVDYTNNFWYQYSIKSQDKTEAIKHLFSPNFGGKILKKDFSLSKESIANSAFHNS